MGALDNLTEILSGGGLGAELPTLSEIGIPARSRLGRAAALPGQAIDAAGNTIAAGAGAVAKVPGAIGDYLLEDPEAVKPIAPPPQMAPPTMAPTPPPPPGPPQGTPPAPSRTIPAMEDVRAIRAKNASAIEGLKAGAGGADDPRLQSPIMDSIGGGGLSGHDLEGRVRAQGEIDKAYGPTTFTDPMAEKIAADEQTLKWENLQPLGAQPKLLIGAPGEDLQEGGDFIPEGAAAPPLGIERIGESRAARAAAAGAGGKAGALKPTDRRALSQDNMRAFYVGELDKLQRALGRDVASGKRSQEQADAEYTKAERNAAFHINALGGDSTAGFFAKPDPYDVPMPAALPPIGR